MEEKRFAIKDIKKAIVFGEWSCLYKLRKLILEDGHDLGIGTVEDMMLCIVDGNLDKFIEVYEEEIIKNKREGMK